MPFKQCSPASHSVVRECEGVVITWACFPSPGISPGETGNSSCRNMFQMKVQSREETWPPPRTRGTEDGAEGCERQAEPWWVGRRGGQGADWAFFPLLLDPVACGVGGDLKRSRSRRLGWEQEGREHAVTIRTGCAWSLSLRRSGFLLSQCFLTHFLSSQSDIYLTLQLRCTGNAKFGGCKHSPCCRVYTRRLTCSAHTHARARAALGHTRAGAGGTRACQRARRDGAWLPFTAGLRWAARHLPALQYPSRSALARALL